MQAINKTAPILALMLLVSGCISGGGGTTTTDNTPTEQATIQSNAQETATGGTVSPTTTEKKGGGISEKLTDIAAAIQSGMAYKCVYTYQGSKGEMQVKGQKFYMKATSDQMAGTSYIISDGTWEYMWGEGQKEGLKFNIQDMKSETSAQGQGYTDMGKVSDSAASVECTPTVVSDSLFTPPSNVKFTDMGEMLKNLKNMQGGTIPEIP